MSSIYDKSSLVLIPSGTKSGKVFSQKPVSGDGDFTFTRSSAATRVNADGNIEKETQNLLLQSNTFDTTWYNSSSTETGGQAGYDGTNDAWLLTKTGANGGIRQNNTTSGVQTFSFYAKANASTWVKVNNLGSSAYSQANFDLVNGVVGTTDYIIDAKIEDVGSGWYRCITTYNTTLVNIDVRVADSDNVVSGTSGSIYIQDAQLNQGLIAQEVITTTTAAVEGGITDNVPRLDYTDSSCPALLLEPQRTNLYQHSEYIFNFQGTETFNDSNSPEGVSNAVKLTKTSASDQFVNMSWSGSSLTASTDYTMSLFVKHAGDDVDVRYEYNNSNDWGKGWYALFQVRSSGVTASTTNLCTSDVEDYGNGWYRILVFVETASSITPSSPSNLLRVVGASGDDVLVYGAGMEQGTYATSYIPTYGSSVTRSKDFVSLTSASDLMNINGTTFLLEVQGISNGGDSRRFSISDGTYNNRAVIELDETADTIKVFLVGNNSVGASLTITGIDQTNNNKIAVAFDSSGVIVYINGEYKTQDTSITLPTALSQIKFRDGGGSNLEMEGYVKQTIVFPSRLTNTELADLTTL